MSSHTDSKRLKKLTPKAMEQYEIRIREFKSKLLPLRDEISLIISRNESISDDTNQTVLSELYESISDYYKRYSDIYHEFVSYLGRTCTQESNIEYLEISGENKFFEITVDNFISKICGLKQKGEVLIQLENMKSSRSIASNHESAFSSSTVARKLAKAEAAKAQMAFVEKEASIRRQQAELDEKEMVAAAARTRRQADLETELKLVQEQKQVAAVTAEAEALENTLSESSRSNHSLKSLPKINSQIRTAEFVRTQDPGFALNPDAVPFSTVSHVRPADYADRNQDQPSIRQCAYPGAEASARQQHEQHSMANDLTKFLLRKDLTMSRLTRFNDKAENYLAWKASFTDVVREIDVSPAEEIDLLVKWLGAESQRHAISLRAAYSNDYRKGLAKVWERLNERYGSAESVHHSVMKKLESFSKFNWKESSKLYELADVLAEIEALKQDPSYAIALSYFDSSIGVTPILGKVPFLQDKWARKAADYKRANNVPFPPFSIFVDFINDQARVRNDPGLTWFTSQSTTDKKDFGKNQVFARKTEVQENRCPIHKTDHRLEACRTFKSKTFMDKKSLLKSNNLCFKCFSSAHKAKDCTVTLKCDICGSSSHCSAMHIYGGEKSGAKPGSQQTFAKDTITSKYTDLVGGQFSGHSCAKTILVNIFPKGQPERSVLVYAIHDEQSNRTLGTTSLFDKLGLHGDWRQYTLNSCSGTTTINARCATDLTVQAIDGSKEIEIKSLIECDIPNDRSEIPTRDIAESYSHLRPIADRISELSTSAEVGLLIGRDVLEAHYVEQQIIGPRETPFAQKLPLGWVIVGEVCLGKFHRPTHINTFKTNLTGDSRPSIFAECEHSLTLKECKEVCNIGSNVFKNTSEDEKLGPSQNDRQFLAIMGKEMKKDESGQWKAPLPFKCPRPRLQDNRPQALQRAHSLDVSLRKNPVKRKHMVEFMQQILETKAAEVAPPLSAGAEVWYLPLFGVYHPRKPDKIRGVFDSAVVYQGTSLNSVLLSGPNLVNSLLGVLLRFRRDNVAVMSDVQQMFYSFLVDERHRDFLRFFWYRNNDPEEAIIEYRMRVHVFGNSPSPSVATFGLRRAVVDADQQVRSFVEKDFYVDDGLTSCPTVDEAVGLVRRTQKILYDNAKIRLHKIASNSIDVMNAFSPEDLEKSLKTVDMFAEDLPTQASLGLGWNLNSDTFVFTLDMPDRPFTKRGVLSAISSFFDPLGFLTPVTVTGRMLVREMTAASQEWDQPIPESFQERWDEWKRSLGALNRLHIPRMFNTISFSQADTRKIHVFCDASEKAISAVAYVVTTLGSDAKVGFVMGKSKLAPAGGTTIPRLELCAAVLATELATIIAEQLGVPLDDFIYHSDSRIVLGYISNRSRRFHTYVANRVQAILRQSTAYQWCYVPTQSNPADLGTRCLSTPEDFTTSPWITGPDFLKKTTIAEPVLRKGTFELIEPEEDKELRPEICAKKTTLTESLASRFKKFSTWPSLNRAICLLKRVIRSRKDYKDCVIEPVTVSKETEEFVICQAQHFTYENEMFALRNQKPVRPSSSICSLTPFLDSRGILRVGGRMQKASFSSAQKHPIILHHKSHVALLLIRHFHNKVHHQGRLITEAAIRSGGFWIVGAKRLIVSVLRGCIICQKLRGKFKVQRMGDLPVDRLTPGAPFTVCGVDVFGPWAVIARKTRGGHSENKRWAVLFTCMATRAAHIEVIESMSSSAFINALRRFVALRGPVKEFRSDRGTNFVGALDGIHAKGICIEDAPVQKHLHDLGTIWRFNPPHASHMGGSWERIIGIARRILDSMLLTNSAHTLTHEVLCTFMCEVCAVINSRPIAQISYDPENPEIISPAMLLTQKMEPLQPLTVSTDLKGLYRSQWKAVQALSNTFWKRWRNGYLQTLQRRCKWKEEQSDVKVGDVVLLKDSELHRNHWPMGIVEKTFPSNYDKKVRTVELRVAKGGKITNYVRPVTQLVSLIE